MEKFGGITDFADFAAALGYEFRDAEYLRMAMTHRSYAAEKNLPYDNQRLEFLGDAVVQIVLTRHLFLGFPEDNEGRLTKMRSALAQQESLARIARDIGVGGHLLLGKGERECGGGDRDSTLADAFEAVIGAIYLDGGLDAAECALLPLVEAIAPSPDELLISLNPKGMLQEYTQKHYNTQPIYALRGHDGPDHAPSFEISVSVNGRFLACGVASKRKTAESAAAQKALEILQDEGLWQPGADAPEE